MDSQLQSSQQRGEREKEKQNRKNMLKLRDENMKEVYTLVINRKKVFADLKKGDIHRVKDR